MWLIAATQPILHKPFFQSVLHDTGKSPEDEGMQPVVHRLIVVAY